MTSHLIDHCDSKCYIVNIKTPIIHTKKKNIKHCTRSIN